MAFAELKEKDEKDDLNRPEEDGKDHLRADILGSIAGSDPNKPGYLGRIDNLITAHGAVSSPPPESASPWMAGANNGPGTTMRPPVGRMTAPLLASDQPAAESEAFSPSSSVGAPLMGPAKPQRSLLGKIGQVASRMGNIAGDVFAPGVMAMIPGTDLNKRMEAAGREARSLKERQIATEETKASASKSEADTKAKLEPSEEAKNFSAGQGKTPEEQFMMDALHGGPNGAPKADAQGQPYNYLTAHKAWKEQEAEAKPEKQGDEDKYVADYLASNKLEDTPANRNAAREKYKTIGPAFSAGAADKRQQKTFEQQEKMFALRQQSLSAATKSMIEAAPTVDGLASRIDPLIDKLESELGPGSGRWTEFWAGKVGEKNPEYTKLRTDVGLLQTALMRMHVGAKGGQEMMAHFKDIIDQGKQDPDNMRAALSEIRQYAHELKEKGVAGGMSSAVLNSGGGGTARKWQQNEQGEYRYSDDGGKTWQTYKKK